MKNADRNPGYDATLTGDQLLTRAAWFEVPYEMDTRAQVVTHEHPEGLSQREVGKVMGLSGAAVQAIEVKALEKLRRRLPWLASMVVEDPPVRTARSRHGVRVQRDALPIEMQERLGAE